MAEGIDVRECLYKGLVGAAGAVPGTVVAHPLDVTKIRMQVSPRATPWVGGIRAAVQAIGCADGTKFQARNFLRGLVPAVQQKVTTRAPMFLLSELCTQLVQSTAGLSRTEACFVGSFGSGFLTGTLASLPEYRKVLTSQRVLPAGAGVGAAALVRQAASSGQLLSLTRRMRGAGLRNGIFDSTFFGVQSALGGHVGGGWTYACAAATAVTVDYSVDVVVKRMMVVPPHEGVDPMWKGFRKLTMGHKSSLHAIAAVHAGLSAKTLEFACSYYMTGTVGVFIGSWLRSFM